MMETFPHPLHGLTVIRTFTAQARALLPAPVLTDPEHPWLRRQEAALPRGVLGVIYYRDGVELVTPQGVTRRAFRGSVELSAAMPAVAERTPVTTVHEPALPSARKRAADRVKAWRAANPTKVAAQIRRKIEQRRVRQSQLREAVAATNRTFEANR